ncbi:MAG: uracil-DNA glycosylase [Nocardioidaceae bacterium]|jgi:uracil-DNA glycosylase|nr:uracil-DNA glycosylase [Nocardioidaceae bacterium]
MPADSALEGLVEQGLMAADWAQALAPVDATIAEMGDFLRGELAKGRGYLPEGTAIFNAFRQPLSGVRVLIVGQDPYPTPGHAMGLSFSVRPEVRPLPRSLINVFTELMDDTGAPRPATGDLSTWADQGVMLLNRCLSVAPGQAGSHRGQGWEQVTDQAITALTARGGPMVAILWGRDAQSLKSRLGATPTIESAHPSPLSAHRGFFGSKPFTRANALLVSQGAQPVDWALPTN